MAIKDYRKNILNFTKALDSSFTKRGKKLTIGLETEMYLTSYKSIKDLNKNNDVMNNILLDLPKEITRDFYPYQLEIRTNPHLNPKLLMDEFKSLVKTCVKVCAKYGCSIIPISWMGGSEMFNQQVTHLPKNIKRIKISETKKQLFINASNDLFI